MTAQPASPDTTTWHSLSTEETLRRQGVDPAAGLTTAEAESRRATYGPNKFAEAEKEPRWQAFLRQYRDPMQLVLLGAGILSLFIPGQVPTAIVLIGLTLFNAAMGLNQEGKAEASVAALQKMMVVNARVRRDGQLSALPMEQLVPGDIVSIEAGDLVPADGRLLTAATLEIDESALTGESLPVPKHVDAVAADAALGDRIDLAFMNTQVTRGAGSLVVTKTGMETEVGHISGMLQATETEVTPLTRQLNQLTNQILVIAGVALAISIGLGLWRDTPFDELFLTAVAFCRVGHPDRPAGGGHRHPVQGHDAARRARRDREAPALGRNARLYLGHQLRQDGHADAEPDDRRPDGGRRAPLRDLRRGLLDRRARSPASAASPTCRSTRCCCRWRSAPMPRCETARWSATPPRARSSSSPPRAASTRR